MDLAERGARYLFGSSKRAFQQATKLADIFSWRMWFRDALAEEWPRLPPTSHFAAKTSPVQLVQQQLRCCRKYSKWHPWCSSIGAFFYNAPWCMVQWGPPMRTNAKSPDHNVETDWNQEDERQVGDTRPRRSYVWHQKGSHSHYEWLHMRLANLLLITLLWMYCRLGKAPSSSEDDATKSYS